MCHQLNQENFNYELWILDEGWGRPHPEDLIQKYQLTNIKLLRFKENPYKYIKQGNLFVCSSVNEDFWLVIGTNFAGPNKLLNLRDDGMLVDNSEEGLYKDLKQILAN